ncbi:MAG: O-methyltransferase [Thermoflexales bacterium]|nr:O-methyltransferase [Thermoflexales bacterium]MDW8350358.1 O-methyltransferase [Anaerolineae bacterium]
MKGTPMTQEMYAYIVETFAAEDELLRRLPAEAKAKGIPQIHIAPEQGRFLQILIGATGARKVLEVGALFGYSTIWMARALPPDGKLITIEINPLHAQTTRENVARAGLTDRVEVREGDARAILPQLRDEAPFDLAFIDAEKAEYLDYVDAALDLVRKGGVIVGDNASARGLAWNPSPPEDARDFVLAIRAFNQRMAADPRLLSLLVPIGDGMCVGVVR